MNFEEAERKYKSFLSERRMFYTRERALIFRVVFARRDHFSVDDLMFHMQNEGLKVSRATLYRSLANLAEADILVEADFGHGHIHYERAGSKAQHEHLVCSGCGRVVEVRSPELTEAIQKIVASEGFDLISHRLQISGKCKECREAKG